MCLISAYQRRYHANIVTDRYGYVTICEHMSIEYIS